MGTGGRVILRRGRMDDDDDDDDGDEEYVVEEDEEEDDDEEEYAAVACSDEDEAEPEHESDADFDGEEEELEFQEEDDELEIETPQPKVRARGSKRKTGSEDESDADFELEEEELEIETPRQKRPAKVRGRGRKGKPETGCESDADFDGEDEEELEDEELEIETPRPKVRGRGSKGKPAGSRRRRHEEDDDYEEEIEEEDEDFDPDADEEDEDEEEEEEVEDDDEDLGDYAPIRAKKVRPKNHVAKRKPPPARRQHSKRRRNGSRVSKGKARTGTSARRRRKRWVADNYEDDEEEEEDEDEDFVVNDHAEEEVNYRPRKKAKVGRKTRDGMTEPIALGEAWPSVESDTSEFEFVTSDEEPAEKEAPTADPVRIKRKKGRRKRGSGSESSSDSDYFISEEELKDLGVPRPRGTAPQPPPPPPPRRTNVLRKVDEKGKEPEEALKQICGICLSEEQRATIQGLLNCCSHYFCFACILEWSKVESRCPLCKQRFNTITKSSVADLGLGLRNAAIRVEKRDQVYQPTEEEMRRWLDPYENVVCIECNQGGDDNLMLLCDICDSSAHTFCVGLGREVPEGNWYCGGCRSGVEGPSYAQTQDRAVHRRESNTNTADSSSSSFGTSISSGVFQRPPPINIQPSLQEFDLNLSPRETPEEDKQAESHISAEPVSTPTGRHATLGRRRALNRRIRILLFRPRIATNVWQNGVQSSRTIPGTEQQNHRSTCTSTEVSPSCSSADFRQSQQSSSPFVQSASKCRPMPFLRSEPQLEWTTTRGACSPLGTDQIIVVIRYGGQHPLPMDLRSDLMPHLLVSRQLEKNGAHDILRQRAFTIPDWPVHLWLHVSMCDLNLRCSSNSIILMPSTKAAEIQSSADKQQRTSLYIKCHAAAVLSLIFGLAKFIFDFKTTSAARRSQYAFSCLLCLLGMLYI